MKKQSFRLLLGATLLFGSLVTLTAFTSNGYKPVVTGGGHSAAGEFNFNILTNADGDLKGHFQHNGEDYAIKCITFPTAAPNAVTIFLNENEYVTVVDNGEGKSGIDAISGVEGGLLPDEMCDDILGDVNSITGGNIQLHKANAMDLMRRIRK